MVENMPSGSAIRPGDVLKMRSGKTVEVLNTDAEGRLILADALSWADDDGADAIVDLVSTGNTLKANHLVEVEHIMDISSRLVVNPASLKLKRETLQPLVQAIRDAVALNAK